MTAMSKLIKATLPKTKGTILSSYELSNISWLKVGGPAEHLYKPYDVSDLQQFLSNLNDGTPIFVIGACSNLLIRDGGISGVCIKLGKNFNEIDIRTDGIKVGAAVPTSRLAVTAAENHCDLAFLRTIPGTVGGAVKMNAGCYGSYVSDYIDSIEVIDRCGNFKNIKKHDLGLNYRISTLPSDFIIISATFKKIKKDAEILKAQMDDALKYRAQIQPINELCCGSAFKNPSGKSSSGKQDSDYSMSAWKLIDEAGFRGFELGGAKVSEKHPNFLVNMGNAKASDIEQLGEAIRQRVSERFGVNLSWEIKLIGESYLNAN